MIFQSLVTQGKPVADTLRELYNSVQCLHLLYSVIVKLVCTNPPSFEASPLHCKESQKGSEKQSGGNFLVGLVSAILTTTSVSRTQEDNVLAILCILKGGGKQEEGTPSIKDHL